jgi:predicted metalloendopeptidase
MNPASRGRYAVARADVKGVREMDGGTMKALATWLMVAGWLWVVGMPAIGAGGEAGGVSPADDFYAWANRDWLAKTTIPADKPRVDNFTALEDAVTAQLRDLMGELKAADERSAEQDKLVRLYESFMDMAQRDARGIASIAGELATIDGLKTHRDVAQRCAFFQTVGIASPVMMAPLPDFKESSMNIGFITQAGLGMEREYYLGTDERSLKQQKFYRAYLSTLFELAAISNAAAAVDQVIALEGQLAGIQWSRVENRDAQKIYNPTTVEAFLKVSSDFYGDDMMKVWGAPREAKLNLMQPSYCEQYGPLFRRIPVSAWQDYLRARLLTAYAGLLTSEFKAALVQYGKDLGLIEEEEEMGKQGIDFVAGDVGMMLGRAYVEKYYNRDMKASVTELVLSIRDTFRSSIEQASWMSAETRKKAIEKLDKMRFKIGYPDEWRDYTALEIPGTELVENHRRAMAFEHNRSMAKIGRPVDRNEWDHSPHEINAFYDSTRNEFVLLAAILHEPFFSETGSAAMKYGGLGFVVGHEIGHGFDDQGCRFDGDGNMVNWWTEEDTKAYGEKKQRLIDQANAYEILPGTFLKGEQEIGEIMGDLSGAQIARIAYQQTPDASDVAFFSQLAQTWRSEWREEFLKMIIQGDVHPPSEFRSNGIVKQFDAFHQAFDIKPGDRMYLAPEERVLLW